MKWRLSGLLWGVTCEPAPTLITLSRRHLGACGLFAASRPWEPASALQKQVLSVLWLGAPACFCQLTKQEKHDLGRVAKVGLRIIFGEAYSGFESTLQTARILRPTVQLSRMSEKFAAKSAKHPKFSKWFQPATTQRPNTRGSKNTQLYTSVPARTARFSKSPIPYMTDLLNAKYHSWMYPV